MKRLCIRVCNDIILQQPKPNFTTRGTQEGDWNWHKTVSMGASLVDLERREAYVSYQIAKDRQFIKKIITQIEEDMG